MQPKPIETVELNETGTKKRVVLFIVAIIVALGAFWYGISNLTKVEAGWYVIEATSASEMNCAQDFEFRYYLGHSGVNSAAENKALNLLYTQATEDAYKIFNARESFADCKNLHYINRHPNEPIRVGKALYEAFTLMEETGSRYMYLGPALQEYNNLFFCMEDSEAENVDPYLNEEQKAYIARVAEFAGNPEHIQLQRMENNTVQLYVSDAYLAFAKEWGITDYLDLYILQDAFIIDYLADKLIQEGYTKGVISSYDGYTRCLGDETLMYGNEVYSQPQAGIASVTAQVRYPGNTALVHFHQLQLNSVRELYYYQYQNGETRTAYLDEKDGLCKAALPFLTATSPEAGCAEMALRLMPLYAADALDRDGLHALADEKIYPMYCDGNTLYSFDPQMKVVKIAEGYSVNE